MRQVITKCCNSKAIVRFCRARADFACGVTCSLPCSCSKKSVDLIDRVPDNSAESSGSAERTKAVRKRKSAGAKRVNIADHYLSFRTRQRRLAEIQPLEPRV